jgi:hypothetical protein
MVVRIGHVQVARLVERHVSWSEQLARRLAGSAPLRQGFAGWRQLLNPVIPSVGDVDIPCRISREADREAELPWVTAWAAVGGA